MAVETVLLGQPLAAAEQVPGQGGEGVVQALLGRQLGRGQAEAVAAGVEQAVAALGLADVAGHQRQVGGQLGGQLQQGGGLAFAQLYQGQVRLDASALGGLHAILELPLA